MPHVNIKHFPAAMTEADRAELASSVTRAIQRAFGCSPDAVSIAIEPVPPSEWRSRVYGPEIEGRRHLLCKHPNYPAPAGGPSPLADAG